ncbi:MAG: dihydrolipoyl dehydrogenase [Opitutales bacterium]|nr:dihydrolipoyl dehydrogenase [Opitutales bacterium]
MDNRSFDLAIIGAGPGGYVAAIRAAQLGLRTVLIEKGELGGTCLNVGCIPSKALLQSTEHFAFIKDGARTHGVESDGVRFDLGRMLQRKEGVITSMRKGVSQLVKSRGAEILKGRAFIERAGLLKVMTSEGEIAVDAKNILIATGSVPVGLPFLPFDGNHVVSSTEALSFESVPERLLVVGGGAIGLEMASIWSRLGAEVTVLEFLPRIAPASDAEVATALEKLLIRQGIRISTATRITGGTASASGVTLEAVKGDEALSFSGDKVLVAVGRKPFTGDLGLESVGVARDSKGRIGVDERFSTNIPGIYAIGDVISGPMLAHKAEEEGIVFAERLAGQVSPLHPEHIPSVIYTDPEVASVGLSEDDAIARFGEVKVGRFSVAANGRAIASGHASGMVKLISLAKDDRLLGVHILAHGASELIASAVAHMTYGGSAEDLARTVHAHPTLSESLREAALSADNRPIHALR